MDIFLISYFFQDSFISSLNLITCSPNMMLLDTELVKKFLEMFEVEFRKTREYERRNGIKEKNGLSNCAEITIAKLPI
jgi:hypothetical protein